MNFTFKERYDIHDLVAIMEILRGEGGCPWDREQDHASIRKNLIEEAYEAVEAIDTQDQALLQEELGDVLMQVVFHARIDQEAGGFDFDDVCNGVCQKLIVRHPHVFGNVTADTSDQVLTNWDRIKRQTKGQSTVAESLRSVPKLLPALMRSEKVQGRAAKAGFEYPDVDGAMKDLKSEVAELEEALQSGDSDRIDEELGDLLFSCVNVGRMSRLDNEHSLTRSCEKFIQRFDRVEQLAKERGVDMSTAGADQLNQLWKEAKRHS